MTEDTLAGIISRRYGEIRDLRSKGIEPFPHRFERTHTAWQAKSSAEDTPVVCAGRIVQIRAMGKASFAHIQDGTGKIQVYLKKDVLGEAGYELFKNYIHIGDFAGVKGKIFLTRTGETTLRAESVTLLSKSIRPLPEKWHGLQDTETRFRARHLDLVSNRDARKIFETRAVIIRSVRKALDSAGFLEVETPALCAQAGGAAARAFQTSSNALDSSLYLRIATELYLKRLIIGGIDKVYEIGKVFRNEGIDTRHNPEFTMLEAYQAYTDYNGMASLLENIIQACASELGVDSVEYMGDKIPLKPPFERISLPGSWKEKCGQDMHAVLDGKSFNRERLLSLAKTLEVAHLETTPSAKVFERIFEAKILGGLGRRPVFIMDYPTAVTPLAKCRQDDESIVERFEFFAGGEEIANAYTELNDPQDQAGRLREQMRQRRSENNEETDILDNDFISAMEAGMPPTGGIGAGIDRLVMLFTGKPSIREVILFPILKQQGIADSA